MTVPVQCKATAHGNQPRDGGTPQIRQSSGALTQILAEQSAPKPLPGTLKAGLEYHGGEDLSNVRVHYDSLLPMRYRAEAFAQGNDIHLAPGQAGHLPHEGWHVVQQRHGRVSSTGKIAGQAINDDVRLEEEADLMGEKARLGAGRLAVPLTNSGVAANAPMQGKFIATGTHVADFMTMVQPAVGMVLKHDTGATNEIIKDSDTPAAPASASFRTKLTEIMTHPTQKAEVNFGHEESEVLVGYYAHPGLGVGMTQQVDMDDIATIEAAVPGQGIAMLAHEIYENFRGHDNVAAGGGMRPFQDVHDEAKLVTDDVLQDYLGAGEYKARARDRKSPVGASGVHDFQNIGINLGDFYYVMLSTIDLATNDIKVSGAHRVNRQELGRFPITNFAADSDAPPSGTVHAVNAAKGALAAEPLATVEVIGHSAWAENMIGSSLAQARADKIKAELETAGVDPKSIYTEDKGASEASGTLWESPSRQADRKVEVVVWGPNMGAAFVAPGP